MCRFLSVLDQYASWDLAFHMIPMAKIDPTFAKEQLLLFLREWYMHPNGQIPAYEFAFGDVNPPVHAWAVWRVFKMEAPRGSRDRQFLARCFQKLLLNFNWWDVRYNVAKSSRCLWTFVMWSLCSSLWHDTKTLPWSPYNLLTIWACQYVVYW